VSCLAFARDTSGHSRFLCTRFFKLQKIASQNDFHPFSEMMKVCVSARCREFHFGIGHLRPCGDAENQGFVSKNRLRQSQVPAIDASPEPPFYLSKDLIRGKMCCSTYSIGGIYERTDSSKREGKGS